MQEVVPAAKKTKLEPKTEENYSEEDEGYENNGNSDNIPSNEDEEPEGSNDQDKKNENLSFFAKFYFE